MSQPDVWFAELGLAPLWVRREGDVAIEARTVDEVTQAVPSTGRQNAPLADRPVDSPTEQRVFLRERTAAVPLAGAPSVSEMPSLDLKQVNPAARADASDASHAFDASDDFAGYETELSAYERVDFIPLSADVDVPSTPRVSVSTLDFPALREHVASCTACGLCEKRTQTVFGVGNEQAEWMIIGEAPGENEDRIGEPFVGQAGKLLDSMLRSVGLNRTENVYIANVIKCRPPGNRNPEPDEVARCEPYLRQQVALVRPKMILALGRFAAQTLLKSDASISSLRGRVHQYEGVPVIVSYHPAYLLRSLPEKSKAWADLCLAQATYRKATS
jgi:uracil-DNA glycosylase